ncbi:MAG: type VI secretion system contractile sheath large subunit [Acidobacteriota bacterium]|nr:type VI secretion system contractile sheath large subunit [Acidobacteriota bacterium]
MPTLTDDFETKITLEAEGTALPDEMPFRLLLIGDWSGRSNRSDLTANNYRAVEIDRDNFEEVMRKLRVELSLDLQNGDVLQLRFEELDDFHPDNIFRQVSLFADLRETRQRLMNPQTFNQTAATVRAWAGESETVKLPADEKPNENPPLQSGNLLDQILFQSAGSSDKPQKQSTGSSELDALVGKLVRPYLVQTDEAEQSKLVEAVDRATGELMRAILHYPQFQALEAAWRGAHLAVSRIETDVDLKIYLLDITKDELKSDLKSVSNLTESTFYKLLTEETAGTFGDESWAAICANYVFKSDVDDVAALMRIAEVCADSKTPFVAQADSEILGVKSLAKTPDAANWKVAEDAPEAKLWSMLRGLPEAAYLGLAVPRILARLPYGAKSEPTEAFSFEESTTEHNQYLWANPSFVCAMLLARSFRSFGWEMEQRILQDIDNLPMHIYKKNGESAIKPGAEIFMTENAAEKVLEQGLMPLVSFRDSDRIRLVRFQSISFPATALRGKWTV